MHYAWFLPRKNSKIKQGRRGSRKVTMNMGNCFIVLACLYFSLCVLVKQVTLLEKPKGPHEDLRTVQSQRPTVMVAVLVRNKAHTLPWFLYYLERLDYPKQRMALWIRSDHNNDESTSMIQEWLKHVRSFYHNVNFQADESQTGVTDKKTRYNDEEGPCHWSDNRFRHVIRLRQEALESARQSWADYFLFLDADNFLVNSKTLVKLIAEQKTIIAPMLNVTVNEHYSNFWCGMDEKGYYKREPEYFPILGRHTEGCFQVAMVHSTLLIDLRKSESRYLAYDPPPPMYPGPLDDIITLAFSAKHAGIPMHILNKELYGYMLVPMESHNTIEEENDQMSHLKLETIIYDRPLQKLEYLEPPFKKEKDTLGFDQVYMINLVRRPDRRRKMLKCFEELGINAKIFDAVDGKQLNKTYLDSLKITMLEDYADPYHNRSLTMGEIGCFLSHYFVWQDAVKNNYEKILIFEDDIRFEPYFRDKLEQMMLELKQFQFEWELVYLGRKRLWVSDESYVDGSETLAYPSYSYWTLSYMLTLKGAQKLLDQQPLGKMVPIDEYLPIMFNKHPNDGWKEKFEPRDLVGLSAEPLLVYPTHYTGQLNYISDTEDSQIIDGTQTADKDSQRGAKDEL